MCRYPRVGIIIPNIPQAWSQHIHNLHANEIRLTRIKFVNSYQGKRAKRRFAPIPSEYLILCHYVHNCSETNIRRFIAQYHDVKLSLLSFVVYPWDTMVSTESAAKGTHKQDQLNVPQEITRTIKDYTDRKGINNSVLTCKLATHKELHSCNLCWFDVQISVQPDKYRSMKIDGTTLVQF